MASLPSRNENDRERRCSLSETPETSSSTTGCRRSKRASSEGAVVSPGKRAVRSSGRRSIGSIDIVEHRFAITPLVREREARKIKKPESREILHYGRRVPVFDSSGRLLIDGKDLCDCQVLECDGCHLPCSRCGSGKCGIECRCNRRWVYESEIQVDTTKLAEPTTE